MDAQDFNIFKDSTFDYYMIRPIELENTTYIDYFRKFEVILKYSNKKIPVRSVKFKDNKGTSCNKNNYVINNK